MKKFISALIMNLVILGIIGVMVILISAVNEPGKIDEYTDKVTSLIEDSNIDTNPEVTQIEEEQVSFSYESQSGINRYFYNQIPDEAKMIYDGLKENEDNMKTGTYIIEYGDSFSHVLSDENGSDTLGAYFQMALQAFRYDNPQIFYIDTGKMVLKMEEVKKVFSTTYNVYIDMGQNQNYLADNFYGRSDIDLAVDAVDSVKDKLVAQKTASTYDNIKLVHDYLVDTVEYDQTLSKNYVYDMFGALVNKLSVCEGYAEAMQYILNEMGIECIYVIGEGSNQQGQSENHAWNYVKLDGKWYGIDVTWDDPIIIGGGTATTDMRYRYFLKGSNEFYEDHLEKIDVDGSSQKLEYPTLEIYDY